MFVFLLLVLYYQLNFRSLVKTVEEHARCNTDVIFGFFSAFLFKKIKLTACIIICLLDCFLLMFVFGTSLIFI